jgi:lysophospholipase L1-like esterase
MTQQRAGISKPVFLLSVACAGLAGISAALLGRWLHEGEKVAFLNAKLNSITSTPFNFATVPYPRANDGRVQGGTDARHKQQCQWAQDSVKAGGGSIILVGDSITHAWEGNMDLLKDTGTFVNLATSGDRTENVLWRLQNGNLPVGLKPRAFVVMIGTNNTGHRMDKPEDIAAGVHAILQRLHDYSSATPIILYNIFPRGAKSDDAMRVNNEKANKLVVDSLTDDLKTVVHVRDLASKYLQTDGTLPNAIMPDLLHPNRKGYEIWAEDLKAGLKELGR